MMKKTILFAMLMILASSVAYGATLVDSDDFESYNNASDLLADNNWWCGVPPTCKSTTGSGTADFLIVDDGGNKYLSMYASGYDGGGSTASLSLQRNTTPLSGIGSSEHWYTLQFWLRGFATYNAGLGGNMKNVYGFMTEAYYNGAVINTGMNPFNTNYLNGFKLGGYYNNSVPTQGRWDMLRYYHNTVLAHVPYALPHITECNISDNNWHLFTKKYKFEFIGGSRNLTQERIYIDSTLCYEYNYTGVTFGSNNYPFSQLYFTLRNNAIISIDDLKFYDGDINVSIYECGDGSDNDGDGYTDFPDDPSCTSLSDNSESPFDYVQCNNGIDDDSDGFIDLADPRCDNATDTSEFPSDATVQTETDCLEEEYCLLYDQFPYNDNISLHGWGEDHAFFSSDLIYSDQRLAFNNLGFIDFNFSKNISHENVYDDVTASFVLFFDNLFESDTTTYTYYVVYKDSDGREVVRLRYSLERATDDPHIKVVLYYHNGTGYELLTTYEPDDEDVLSRALFILDIDQVLKTFNLSISAGGTLGYSSSDLAWTNVLASKVNSFWIEQGNFSSTKWEVVMDDVSIFGSFLGQVTTCDTWDLPYYLVESFNGYLSECGWLTSNVIYNDGELRVTDDISYYFTQKNTDLAEEANTDFVTMTFDLNVETISVVGSTITFRLYDDDGFNFMTAYFRDTGDFLFYNDDGTGRVAGNVTLNTTIPYKFVIDLADDEWDIYLNNSLVVTESDFTDAFVNIHNVQTVKITSNDATFELDNLKIFSSDSTGSPLLPDEDLEPGIVDDEFKFCGHFWTDPVVCSVDADCITGKCGVNNKCSGFDYTYCDENEMTRGNKCVMSAMAFCFLGSTGDLILDNFFLFLILLLILMGVTYLVIMLRRKG